MSKSQPYRTFSYHVKSGRVPSLMQEHRSNPLALHLHVSVDPSKLEALYRHTRQVDPLLPEWERLSDADRQTFLKGAQIAVKLWNGETVQGLTLKDCLPSELTKGG
jgi:hypothetical protein